MSEALIEYDPYNRVYKTRYRYRTPTGMNWLISSSGEVVVDELPGTGNAHRDEPKVYENANRVVSTLNMMDASYTL